MGELQDRGMHVLWSRNHRSMAGAQGGGVRVRQDLLHVSLGGQRDCPVAQGLDVKLRDTAEPAGRPVRSGQPDTL